MGLATAITAAASIGGAIIGSKNAKKARNAITDSTDQQIGLQREIFDYQKGLTAPFHETGVAANKAAATMMGLAPGGYNNSGRHAGNYLSRFNGAKRRVPYQTEGGFPVTRYSGGSRFAPRGKLTHAALVNGGSRSIGGQGAGAGYNPLANLQPATSNGRPVYQNKQLNALVQSPGYEFRLQEGLNALDQSAAARGGLLSGGHLKRATRYAQDYASGEFNTRFNQLNALSGGGQVAGQNASTAGSAFGQGASHALASAGQARADYINQRGSIFGNALGMIGGIIANKI